MQSTSNYLLEELLSDDGCWIGCRILATSRRRGTKNDCDTREGDFRDWKNVAKEFRTLPRGLNLSSSPNDSAFWVRTNSGRRNRWCVFLDDTLVLGLWIAALLTVSENDLLLRTVNPPTIHGLHIGNQCENLELIAIRWDARQD